MTLDFGPIVLSGRPKPAPDGTATAYAPRRYRFDPMLADAAVAAGASLREGVSFVEPLVEGGRVAGIRTRNAAGRTEDIRARLVVGADGKRSNSPRPSALRSMTTGRPPPACTMPTGAASTHPDTRLFIREGLFGAAAATNDGLTFLGIVWPHAELARVRADIGNAYREAAATIPWIADRLASATQAERFVGTGDLDAFFRTASGPGWALLGMRTHKDPIDRAGLTDALLDAKLLAAAVVEGVGPAADAALSDYGRRRDAAARPVHGLTAEFAGLAAPPPAMIELLHALRGNPADTARFLGVIRTNGCGR